MNPDIGALPGGPLTRTNLGCIESATSSFLDSVRGISALIVAVVHAFQVFLLPFVGLGSLPHLLTSLAATYAVLAFFIVSGFMIYMSVNKHRTYDGKFDAGAFLRARIIRIYPPFLAALAITLLAYLLIATLGLHGAESYRLGGELALARERAEFDWDSLPSTLLLAHGVFPRTLPPPSMNGPLWTLSYEFWFYMLAMMAIASFRNRHYLWGHLPLLSFAVIVITGGNRLFLIFLLCWCGGFLMGALYRRGVLHSPTFTRNAGYLALIFSALLLVIVSDNPIGRLINPFLGARSQYGMMVACWLFTLLLAAGINRQTRLPLKSTAAYSYTLYLIHYPLLLVAFSLLHPVLHHFNWAVSLAAALGVVGLIVPVSKWLASIVEDRTRIRRLLAFKMERA
jgi:peptidoglycan/LPS O-acetylase OafA/YrhL